ncbi:nascent polypeptide-associated complex subunit alpha, muscle-specific form-like isoform X2 [Ceratina calcarata]|uniref:Nascent polypeptide-associated complex subunit alpha, muscle-specific form-like isoform X2 n=1 Tax=Ceratina calcarata TaxID=156304 RepID=A0AAJ7S9T9_9HYME|nr:nascent polypeptide-associated complex subunit alpha, muscle-specific form-like isoform X2 [Ceratina calcarata]
MRTILCAVGFVLILLGTGVRSQNSSSFWERVVNWLPKLRNDATKFPLWPTHNTSFVCERDGFFPDKTDCRMFYHCVQIVTSNFMRHVFKCNDNLIYSVKNESCVKPEYNDRSECVEYIKGKSIDIGKTQDKDETKEDDEDAEKKADEFTDSEKNKNKEQKNRTNESWKDSAKYKDNGIGKDKANINPFGASEEKDGVNGGTDFVLTEWPRTKRFLNLPNIIENLMRDSSSEGCDSEDSDDYGECDSDSASRTSPHTRATPRPTPRTQPPTRATPRPTPRTQPPTRPTPRPAPRTQPPTRATPRPTPRTQPPTTRTQPPTYTTPPPTYTTPPPTYTTPPPTTRTQPPTHTTPPPTTHTQPPTRITPRPTTRTPPPASTTHPPTPRTQPPTRATHPPVTHTPTRATPRPTPRTQPPTTRTQLPTHTTPPPTTRTQPPTRTTPRPTTRTHPPARTTHSPVTRAPPPASTTHPPTPRTQPPARTTHSPTSRTQPPTRATHPPVTRTPHPATTTRPPTPRTQPPARTTHPPLPRTHPPTRATHPPVTRTPPPTRTTPRPTTRTPPPASTTHPPTPRTQPPASFTHPPTPKPTVPTHLLYTSDGTASSPTLDGLGTSHSTDTDCKHLLELVTGALFPKIKFDKLSPSLSHDGRWTPKDTKPDRIEHTSDVTTVASITQVKDGLTTPPRLPPIQPASTAKPVIRIPVTTAQPLVHADPPEILGSTKKPDVVDDSSDSEHSPVQDSTEESSIKPPGIGHPKLPTTVQTDAPETSEGTKELDEDEYPDSSILIPKKDWGQQLKPKPSISEEIPTIGQTDSGKILGSTKKPDVVDDSSDSEHSPVQDSTEESSIKPPGIGHPKLPTTVQTDAPETSEGTKELDEDEYPDSSILIPKKDWGQQLKPKPSISEEIPTIGQTDSGKILGSTKKPDVVDDSSDSEHSPVQDSTEESSIKPPGIGHTKLPATFQTDSPETSEGIKELDGDEYPDSSILIPKKDWGQQLKPKPSSSEEIPTIGQTDSGKILGSTKKPDVIDDSSDSEHSPVQDSTEKSSIKPPGTGHTKLPATLQTDSPETSEGIKELDGDEYPDSSIFIPKKDRWQQLKPVPSISEKIPTIGQTDSPEILGSTKKPDVVDDSSDSEHSSVQDSTEESSIKPPGIGHPKLLATVQTDAPETSEVTKKLDEDEYLDSSILIPKKDRGQQLKPVPSSSEKIPTIGQTDSPEILGSTKKPDVVDDSSDSEHSPVQDSSEESSIKPPGIGHTKLPATLQTDSPETSAGIKELDGDEYPDSSIFSPTKDWGQQLKPVPFSSEEIPTIGQTDSSEIFDSTKKPSVSEELGKKTTDTSVDFITTKKDGIVYTTKPVTHRPEIKPGEDEDSSEGTASTAESCYTDCKSESEKPSVTPVLTQESSMETPGLNDTVLLFKDPTDSYKTLKSTQKPGVTDDLHKVTGTVEITDSDQKPSTDSIAKPKGPGTEVIPSKSPGPKDVQILSGNQTKLLELSLTDVRNLINVLLQYKILIPNRYYTMDELTIKFDEFAIVLFELIRIVGYGTRYDGVIKIPSVTGPKYPKKADHGSCTQSGYFPNTMDCSKFYRCIPFGSRYLRYDFQCKIGTVWDARINTCNFLANVPKNGSCTPPLYSTLDQSKYSDGHVLKRTCFHCPSGIQRHPEYCNIFYQCAVDEHMQIGLTTFACPPGTIFTTDDEGRAGCLSKLIFEKIDDCVDLDLQRKSIKIIDLKPEKSTCSEMGRFPFSDDCSSTYLKCVQLKDGYFDAYLRDCPPGKVFSSREKRCVEARSLGC